MPYTKTYLRRVFKIHIYNQVCDENQIKTRNHFKTKISVSVSFKNYF